MNRSFQCPGVVIGAAVLLMVYGAILVCEGGGLGALAVAEFFIPKPPRHPQPPEVQERERVNTFLFFTYFIWDVIIGMVMLVAAFGMVRGSRPARLAILMSAICQCLKAICVVVILAILLSPAFVDERANPMALIFIVPLWIMVLSAAGLAVAFCVPAMVLLCLKSAQQAFADEFDASPPPDF